MLRFTEESYYIKKAKAAEEATGKKWRIRTKILELITYEDY
jgi:hypothetical protein